MKTSGETNSTALLPRACLKCGYNLRGLPVPTKCPECGKWSHEATYVWHRVYAWTPRTESWRKKYKDEIMLVLMFGTPLLLGFCVAAAKAVSIGWWPVMSEQVTRSIPLCTIVLLFATLAYFGRWRVRWHGRMVVKNGHIKIAGCSRPIDPNEITHISVDMHDLNCTIHKSAADFRKRSNGTFARCDEHLYCMASELRGFESRDDMLAFVDAVNRYARQYSAHAENGGNAVK